ncbi:hypothetical protein PsorP6_002773 [Peronosclerospora sorghi]|uniref:Uncharacterized protein n=1 Tax=Peronosclerospora sorghi TaxID=230839 RepID=A0ACC0VJA8_9STRA|nr:hypothetical protein PsorP6_002773 [Peronosclerospora sorghi]
MQDYTQSAEPNRADMQKPRKRCAVVSGNQRCELTGQNIMGKKFYLFPFYHALDASALRQEMQKHLNSFQRQTVKQLIQKLNELSTEMPVSNNLFHRPLAAFSFLNLYSSEEEVMTPGVEGNSAAVNAEAKNAAKEQSIAQEREMVQQKHDEIIASECIFCDEWCNVLSSHVGVQSAASIGTLPYVKVLDHQQVLMLEPRLLLEFHLVSIKSFELICVPYVDEYLRHAIHLIHLEQTLIWGLEEVARLDLTVALHDRLALMTKVDAPEQYEGCAPSLLAVRLQCYH